MMIKRSMFFVKILFVIACLLFVSGREACASNLFINLVAVNSTNVAKEYPIKYYLPKELTPEDIINLGGLKLEYDIDKKTYWVKGSIALGPKESRTIKLEVRDIWKISEEEARVLKQQLQDNLILLNNTEYEEGAKLIVGKMTAEIDHILAQQATLADTIDRRIELYRTYKVVLDNIRNHAFSMDYLREEVKAQQEGGDKTVQFVIQVKNDLEKKEKEVSQKHYLPQEIKPEDVVDSQGFEYRFDNDRQQGFLAKTETLAPGESKKYTIVLRDVWSLSSSGLTTLQEKAQTIFDELQGSEYEDAASFLFNAIKESVQFIESSQQDRQDVKKYIGAFRANEKRLEDAKSDLQRLEQMLAVVKAKKLEELESRKVKNVLQKLKALAGIAAISTAIFGSVPSVTTTWKVIWGVMGFIAFFTALHFFTWWRRSAIMGEGAGIKPGESITPAAPPKPPEEPEKK